VATFFDTHAHLDDPAFAQDLPAVLERAEAAGVTRIVTIGTDLDSSRQAVALADQYAPLYAAVGWIPTNAPQAPEDVRPDLRTLARHPKVVAIGEIGLDYYRLPSHEHGGSPEDDQRHRELQHRLFHQQLELAAELGLNCVVHQRDSFEDTLAAVRPFAGRVRCVFHCFVNGPADLRRVVDLGSLVSFTGIATFKNADTVRAAAAAAPLNAFMLETDAPYLAPVPHRGKRSEPAHVPHTAEAIARARGVSLDELSRATCDTARVFFRGMA
jgi:TatD DNase family protein